jgi:hypothetical protein
MKGFWREKGLGYPEYFHWSLDRMVARELYWIHDSLFLFGGWCGSRAILWPQDHGKILGVK